MKCLVCGGACCEGPITVTESDDWILNEIQKPWIALRSTPTGRCMALQSDGRCGIYETRPLVCRVYPPGNPDCLRVVKLYRTPDQYQRIRDESDPLAL